MANRPEKVRNVPSSITGELGQYLEEMRRAINRAPTMSYFSGTTPNSNVTGLAGDLAVNVGSASTDTRLWIKGGSTAVPGMTNWVTLRTGPA